MQFGSHLRVLTCSLPVALALGFPASAQEDAPAGRTVEVDGGIGMSLQYSDNIFLTSNDRRGDFLTTLTPWLDLSMQSGDFELTFGASAELGRFAGNASENYDDFLISTDARYRLGSAMFLFGGLEFSWDHEDRNSPDDVNGIEPTKLREAGGYVGIGGKVNGRNFRFGINLRDLNFDDTLAAGGAVINNDDRDRTQAEIGGRIAVRSTDRGEVFVQGIYDRRDYDQEVDDLGYRRSSEGIQAALGYTGRIGALTGEATLGLQSQNYDDPRFGTVTRPIFGADLTWRPSDDTTVTGVIERTLEETTLSGASGYLATSAGARVRYRIAQDLSAAGYFFLTQNDYQGVDRTDTVAETGFGLRYFFNPRLYLDADYEYRQRLSDVAGAEFDEHRIILSLGTDLQPNYEPREGGKASFGTREAYVGVQAGAGVLQTKVDGPRGGGSGDLTADFGDSGALGGVFAGYRAMLGNLVLGVEADVETGDMEWTHEAGRDFSVRTGNSYSLSAIAGVRTAARNLAYGRFGISSTEFESSYETKEGLTVIDEAKTGFSVGVGAEVPLARGLSGRIEYLLRSFEDYQIGGVLGAPSNDNFANLQGIARFGLVYQIGATPEIPVEAEPTDFSGFYAGAQLGHGALQSENAGSRPISESPSFLLETIRTGQGFAGSAIAGYGFQRGRFYVGPEVDVEVSSLGWNIERSPEGRVYSVDKVASVSAMLRVGYVLDDNVLLFGRIGAARSKFNTTYDYSGVSVDQDDYLSGVKIGAGVEFALKKNTHVRFEFTRTDHGAHAVDYGLGVDEFDTSDNLFQVGVTYQF